MPSERKPRGEKGRGWTWWSAHSARWPYFHCHQIPHTMWCGSSMLPHLWSPSQIPTSTRTRKGQGLGLTVHSIPQHGAQGLASVLRKPQAHCWGQLDAASAPWSRTQWVADTMLLLVWNLLWVGPAFTLALSSTCQLLLRGLLCSPGPWGAPWWCWLWCYGLASAAAKYCDPTVTGVQAAAEPPAPPAFASPVCEVCLPSCQGYSPPWQSAVYKDAAYNTDHLIPGSLFVVPLFCL